MPAGIGRQGSSLAGQATAQQGIPEMAIPSGPLAGLETLLLNLRSGGQIAPEELLQLLALITGGGLPGGAGPSGGGDPIAAALAGAGGGGPLPL